MNMQILFISEVAEYLSVSLLTSKSFLNVFEMEVFRSVSFTLVHDRLAVMMTELLHVYTG